MADLSDFQTLYQNELLPVLEEFESERKKVARNLSIAAAVVVPLVLFVIYLLRSGGDAMFIPLVVGGLILAGLYKWMTRAYVLAFKNQLVGRLVSHIDPGLSYEPTSTISEGTFRASKLFNHRIDRYRGEDYVSGTLDKTALRFSECHAEYKTTTRDSKGHTKTQWHTIFKGLFFVADFNKHFQGETYVLPDTAQKLFGKLGQKLQSMNMTRPDLVKLEDPEFEKAFAVHATDQIEARYILSPALMRRIVEFRTRTRSTVYLSFVGSNVYVAVASGRDRFEPRIFRTLLDFALVEGILNDLQLVTGIVEDLNLNTRIWTKE